MNEGNPLSGTTNVYPRLFDFHGFGLPTYGLLVSIGVIVGLMVVFKVARQQGLDPEQMWNLGALVILAGILGAKVLLIVDDWGYYSRHPHEIFSLNVLQSGGVFSGGLVAAILVAFWYVRKNRLPFLRICDTFAPGVAIGHAFGRMGCFAAGCCYGRPTSEPWGVTFTNPLAYQWVGTPLGVKLHPTELYEMVVEVINFLVLYWLLRRKKFEGQVIGLYMILYGVARFFIEFFRGDPGRGEVFGGFMTGTQLIALLMVVAGGVLWVARVSLQPPSQEKPSARKRSTRPAIAPASR
jgi:phosphatidylglycerol:prolipoprotein diacylglycerol transferase